MKVLSCHKVMCLELTGQSACLFMKTSDLCDVT